jgi:hypothetical protein
MILHEITIQSNGKADEKNLATKKDGTTNQEDCRLRGVVFKTNNIKDSNHQRNPGNNQEIARNHFSMVRMVMPEAQNIKQTGGNKNSQKN